jgi:hypothetical protein
VCSADAHERRVRELGRAVCRRDISGFSPDIFRANEGCVRSAGRLAGTASGCSVSTAERSASEAGCMTSPSTQERSEPPSALGTKTTATIFRSTCSCPAVPKAGLRCGAARWAIAPIGPSRARLGFNVGVEMLKGRGPSVGLTYRL